MNVEIFNSPDLLGDALAKQVSELIQAKTSNNEYFHLALPGGNSPKPLFNHLVATYSQSINWSKVKLFWGDERCVSANHGDSNYGMVESNLLKYIQIPSMNVFRIKGEEQAEQEARRYEETIMANVTKQKNIPAFDLIILGMGDDGHTASLFPNQKELLYSNNLCEVSKHPVTGLNRITFTPKLINNAAKVMFIITGTNKAQKVYDIYKKSSLAENYPAYYIKPTGELVYFLDRKAALLIQ